MLLRLQVVVLLLVRLPQVMLVLLQTATLQQVMLGLVPTQRPPLLRSLSLPLRLLYAM